MKPAGPGKYMATFTFEAPQGTNKVNLAGTFNQWSGSGTPMAKSGNVWTQTVELGEGTYEYKFVVDEKDWKYDPKNPESVDDTYGSRNSVLRVGSGIAAVAATPAPAKHGKPIQWGTDIPAAMKNAAQTKKQILVFFASPGSENSKYIENSILADARVGGVIESKYVCVKIDVKTQAELAKKLGVFRGGVIIVYRSDGTAVKQLDRVFTAEQMLAEL